MGKTLRLTPGFRFHPTNVELVKYYLKRKILGKKFIVDAIAEVDVYKHSPWDLPDKSCLKSGDLKWYFFCPREKKYACGERINRATEFGYWKTTGKDRPVKYNGEVAGTIKTLVFHRGRAPDGVRTDWVMHEYRLNDKDLIHIQDSYALCMIFKKEGPGPRNGAHYGAPFNEEEWTDNEEEMIAEIGSSSKTSEPNLMVPTSESCISGIAITPSPVALQPVSNHAIGLNNSVASTSLPPGCRGVGSSSESCVSDVLAPSVHQPSSLPASNDDLGLDELPIIGSDDDLLLLYNFGDGGPFELTENNKATNNVEQHHAVNGAPRTVGIDVFEGLDDLGNLADLGDNGVGVSNTRNPEEMFYDDDGHFVELMDLGMPLAADLSVNLGDDGIQYNQLSTGFSSYPGSSTSGYQADMAAEEYWLGAGNSTTQVNAVNPVQSMPTGRAFGIEDYQLNSYTSSAAPNNYSHSLPRPEIMDQNTQADSMYGSQNLPGWKT